MAHLTTTLAYFGINSSALNLAVDLIVVFFGVLYLSLLYWTFADARRRIADPLLVGCATVASLFPFVGTLIYMILRPPEYLDDVRERELEMQAAQARIAELDFSLCPGCGSVVERDFIRCPRCLAKLRERCTECSRPLDPAWTICPYCEAQAPAPPEVRSRSRRRRSLERDVERGGASIGERPLSSEDLLGQTVESDPLSLSAEGDALAPASGSESSRRTPAPRRSRRPPRG